MSADFFMMSKCDISHTHTHIHKSKSKSHMTCTRIYHSIVDVHLLSLLVCDTLVIKMINVRIIDFLWKKNEMNK